MLNKTKYKEFLKDLVNDRLPGCNCESVDIWNYPNAATVVLRNPDLNFEHLNELSKLFNTRKINLDSHDESYVEYSSHGHYHYIEIYISDITWPEEP